MNVLVLNCGSPAAKFAVIDAASRVERISGLAQCLGSSQSSLDWKIDGQKHTKDLHHATHDGALRAIVQLGVEGSDHADDAPDGRRHRHE